jgi:hypothetical protein
VGQSVTAERVPSLALRDALGDLGLAKPSRCLPSSSRDAANGAKRKDAGAAQRAAPLLRTGKNVGSFMADFVPPDFEVPVGLATPDFVLEPLGREHNDRDYEAWTSSMEHIAETPRFPWGSWPREMTPDKNRENLERHADGFHTGRGFTYTRCSIRLM